MDTGSSLCVHLLGGFRLTRDGRPIIPPIPTRLQHLLAYLCLHQGDAISRHQLAFALWPDTTEEQAHSNLRNLLHRLTEALPESRQLLAIERRAICWRPGHALTLDADEFAAAFARGRAARLAGDRPAERQALLEAMAFYTGDLLPDCYDDWIAPLRERLAQMALQAVERLARLLEESGDYPAALSWALRLMQADPLNEAAYRQLMHLHALNGERVGVVRIFNLCQATLRRELGAEPDPETRTAYQTALAQAAENAGRPSARPAAGPPMAPPTAGLLGRDEALAHIRRLLADQRLVTLVGPAGVGKSALARQAAFACRDDFPDGVRWVDLGPVMDEALLADAVSAALGVREAAARSTLAALEDWLCDRRLLLVLDNCEHLAGHVGRLARALLQAAAGLSILAAGQQPLGIQEEMVWRVPPLAAPQAPAISTGAADCDLAALVASSERNASVRLFVERARAALPTFALTAGNISDVIHICRRLDGNPLMIELAAARVRALAPAQIAARLERAFALLDSGDDPTPAGTRRQPTLWAALEWSHALLSPPEQVLLRRLAVFPGSFTLEDAEAVCSGHGLAVEQVLSAFAGLEDKSLVQSEPAHGRPRFRLHEVGRQYAGAKLAAAGEAARVEARHLDVYGRLAGEAAGHLAAEQQAAWLERLEAEHDNLRAALAYAGRSAGNLEVGLRLVGDLARFWATRGHFKEGRYWAGLLLAAAAPEGVTAGRLAALRAAANLAYYQTDYGAARALYEQALAAARALDDRPAIAMILRGLGTVAHGQADCEQALAWYRESLALCREIGDRGGEAAALANLGLAAWQHGDAAAGREHIEACLALRRQLGDEVGIAYVLHLLADIAWSEGRAVEAQSLNEASLAMRRRLGDRWGIAYSLDSLAVIAGRQGDAGRARTLFAESLRLFYELGSQHGLGDVLDHLAGLLAAEDNTVAAGQLMAAAAALREAIHAALPPNMQQEHDRQLDQIRAQLGDERFRAAWLLGRALTTPRAVELALALTAS